MPADPKEPEITINGHRLLPGQALTLRVAFEAFADELQRNPNAFGADDIGRSIRAAYLKQSGTMRGFFMRRKPGRPFGWRRAAAAAPASPAAAIAEAS